MQFIRFHHVTCSCRLTLHDRTSRYVIAETPPHYIVRIMLCCIILAILHYDIMVYGILTSFYPQYATVYRALVYYILLALFLHDSYFF